MDSFFNSNILRIKTKPLQIEKKLRREQRAEMAKEMFEWLQQEIKLVNQKLRAEILASTP